MSEPNYIRAGGGVSVDARKVGLVLAVALTMALGACSIWQAASTSSANSAAARLQRAGVPVQVTVTSCTGVSSGIGMAIEYYRCDGSYTLDGSTRSEFIHGNRAQLPTGSVVAGRVVPSDPGSLTRAGSGTSGSQSYALSIVLGALTVLAAAALAVWRRRRSLGDGVSE